MREYLKRWQSLKSVDIVRHTELRADVVRAGRCSVSRKCSLGEIPALLGLVLDEGGGIGIGLRHGDIEDAGAGRDCDWNRQIGTKFGSCRGSKDSHCES